MLVNKSRTSFKTVQPRRQFFDKLPGLPQREKSEAFIRSIPYINNMRVWMILGAFGGALTLNHLIKVNYSIKDEKETNRYYRLTDKVS